MPPRYLALIVPFSCWGPVAHGAATLPPKIGVALKRGGVGYIAGTSMGGLVGGWRHAIGSKIPFDARSYCRKGDLCAFQTSIGIAGVCSAPSSSRLPSVGSVVLVAETLFGPLFVGGSLGDSGHRKVYVPLGKAL